jgi:arylsulfatase B
VVWYLLAACGGSGVGHSVPTADTEPPVETGATAQGSTVVGSSDTATARPRPTNILLVVADDLGTDKVGVYGEHPLAPPTPQLDAFAREGLLFRNAWSNPSCSPTRAALLTGRHARRTGVGRVVDAYDSGAYALPSREILIPELLALAPDAWTTSFVGKWHLAAWEAPAVARNPLDQGFQRALSHVSNIDQSSDRSRVESYYDWEVAEDGVLAWHTEYLTTWQVDQTIAQVQSLPEPWFVELALTAPHTPLNSPPESLYTQPFTPPGDTQAERYHVVVEALDTELGRLFSVIDRSDTLVLFVSDNGTPDHAILAPLDPAHGKLSLFQGGIHVPMWAVGPQVRTPGAETAALVEAVDVFATVAEVAGVPLGALVDETGQAVPIDGRSILPILDDPAASVHDVVYAEDFYPLGLGSAPEGSGRAVRNARFKLLADDITGQEALYDLAGRVDDGPNLLLAGPLSPDAQAGYDALRAALDDIRATVVPQTEP